MDLEALKLFCDVVDCGSFTAAAQRNYVTQPAASQRIQSLERRLGQVLIERGQGKGRVCPTEAGAALYEGARALLREAEELEARVCGLSDEVAGTVRVATVYSVGLHALPGRLKPFLAAHPRVNVHLEYSRTDKVYQDVVSGAMDVGIVACPSPRSGVEVVPFGEEEMVVICAPEHRFGERVSRGDAEGARRELPRLPLRGLEGEAFIAFADEIPTRKLTDERLRAAGVHVRIAASFDNIETIKNLVEIGSGVALVPEDTVRQEVREGALVAIPLAPADSFRRPVGILLKRTRTRRAAVRAFVEAMRAPG